MQITLRVCLCSGVWGATRRLQSNLSVKCYISRVMLSGKKNWQTEPKAEAWKLCTFEIKTSPYAYRLDPHVCACVFVSKYVGYVYIYIIYIYRCIKTAYKHTHICWFQNIQICPSDFLVFPAGQKSSRHVGKPPPGGGGNYFLPLFWGEHYPTGSQRGFCCTKRQNWACAPNV